MLSVQTRWLFHAWINAVMDSQFIKVRIESISVINYNYIVLLKREGEERVLPICIGPTEAQSIACAYNRKQFARPWTHDLMKNLLAELNCTLDRIHVTDLQNGTYFARIYLTTGDGRALDVDSRPSDAMALAVRYNAPIFVRDDILRENAIEMGESADKSETLEGEAKPGAAAEPTIEDPVTKLKKTLAASIAEERYEDAAKLRDELDRLQKHN